MILGLFLLNKYSFVTPDTRVFFKVIDRRIWDVLDNKDINNNKVRTFVSVHLS